MDYTDEQRDNALVNLRSNRDQQRLLKVGEEAPIRGGQDELRNEDDQPRRPYWTAPLVNVLNNDAAVGLQPTVVAQEEDNAEPVGAVGDNGQDEPEGNGDQQRGAVELQPTVAAQEEDNVEPVGAGGDNGQDEPEGNGDEQRGAGDWASCALARRCIGRSCCACAVGCYFCAAIVVLVLAVVAAIVMTDAIAGFQDYPPLPSAIIPAQRPRVGREAASPADAIASFKSSVPVLMEHAADAQLSADGYGPGSGLVEALIGAFGDLRGDSRRCEKSNNLAEQLELLHSEAHYILGNASEQAERRRSSLVDLETRLIHDINSLWFLGPLPKCTPGSIHLCAWQQLRRLAHHLLGGGRSAAERAAGHAGSLLTHIGEDAQSASRSTAELLEVQRRLETVSYVPCFAKVRIDNWRAQEPAQWLAIERSKGGGAKRGLSLEGVRAFTSTMCLQGEEAIRQLQLSQQGGIAARSEVHIQTAADLEAVQQSLEKLVGGDEELAFKYLERIRKILEQTCAQDGIERR